MIDVILTTIPKRTCFDGVFEPHEKGSVSTYRNVLLGCAHRENLGVDFEQVSKGAQLSGVFFHVMAEHYHDGKNAVFDLAETPDELAEARRLFAAYTKRVGPNDWGQIYGAELPIPSKREHRSVVESLLGVNNFKAVLDLVCVMSAEDIERWGQRGLRLPGPGTYVVDHKTTGKWSEENYEQQLLDSYQFIVYPELVQHFIDEKIFDLPPVQGMIGNTIVSHKDPKFHWCFSTRQPWIMDVIRRDFGIAQARLDRSEKNSAACYGQWGKPCFALTNGKCERTKC